MRNGKKSLKITLPGQAFKLQDTEFLFEPKQVPPYCSSLLLDLVLDFLPGPQVLEHDEKLDQVDQTQFSENIFFILENIIDEKW